MPSWSESLCLMHLLQISALSTRFRVLIELVRAKNPRLRQYSIDEEIEDTSHVAYESLGGEEQPISKNLEAQLQTHEHHKGILCNLRWTTYTLSCSCSLLLFHAWLSNIQADKKLCAHVLKNKQVTFMAHGWFPGTKLSTMFTIYQISDFSTVLIHCMQLQIVLTNKIYDSINGTVDLGFLHVWKAMWPFPSEIFEGSLILVLQKLCLFQYPHGMQWNTRMYILNPHPSTTLQ